MKQPLEEQRERMLEDHLRGRGVGDPRVLGAMGRIPRELFTRPQDRIRAYADSAMPIDLGQTISQPYIVGLMTQELAPAAASRVLEIGTGSGYQTAVLAELAGEVFTVERIAELSEGAREVLSGLGYANIRFMIGDGTLGWPEHAPYDRIIVTAGAPRCPEALIEQLAEGGRLAIPIGGESLQQLTVFERRSGAVIKREVCGCVFVPLIGRDGWAERRE
ncbi:MAG TPA: protein-L-isoaspartate(D-aspartate) O-methyltransferase [Candidatus Brocadiia bacterium]|nr:protein-L-isoaspartate(D-aspartate) O-methyltransferase [Candidatus Brocadiia bacterium]